MEPKPFEGWAVFGVNGDICEYSLRATESESIGAYADASCYPWGLSKPRGCRCLPVTVTRREVKP